MVLAVGLVSQLRQSSYGEAWFGESCKPGQQYPVSSFCSALASRNARPAKPSRNYRWRKGLSGPVDPHPRWLSAPPLGTIGWQLRQAGCHPPSTDLAASKRIPKALTFRSLLQPHLGALSLGLIAVAVERA